MAHITRSQTKPSFRCFKELPKELRLIVWKEAMPDYGIVQINCEYRPSSGGRPNTFVELPHTNACGPAFSMRIQITRVLLNTCHESRIELHHHFPHSIPSVGAEVRFHGARDTIYLSDLDEDLAIRFWVNQNWGHPSLIFEDGWNRIAQKVAIDNSSVEVAWRDSFAYQDEPDSNLMGRLEQDIRRFPSLFPQLRQLYLTNDLVISKKRWNKAKVDVRQRLNNALGQCYTGGVQWSHERPGQVGFQMDDVAKLTLAMNPIKRVLHGDPNPTEDMPWEHRPHFSTTQPATFEIFTMVNTHAELEGLCKRVPTE